MHGTIFFEWLSESKSATPEPFVLLAGPSASYACLLPVQRRWAMCELRLFEGRHSLRELFTFAPRSVLQRGRWRCSRGPCCGCLVSLGLSDTVADQSTGASQVAIVSQAHLLDTGDAYQLSRLHSSVTAPSQTLSSVLPAFTNTVSPKFVWGESYDREFINSMIVGWRGNLFLTPSGRAGKAFVVEIVHLVRGYASLEVITLRAVFVMQALLLKSLMRDPKHAIMYCISLEALSFGRSATAVPFFVKGLHFRGSSKSQDLL